MLNIERYINFIGDENGIENEPDDVKKGKEDWIGSIEDLDYVCKFLVDYEITGDSIDWIESNKIAEWLVINNIGISIKKMSIELNNYCIKKHLNRVDRKDKKIDGKTKKYGLELKIEQLKIKGQPKKV